uniref:Amino acid transporter transmembrane domain-containing protein n=1 Tax=Aegilops tauschii subsp. strangulata TaxID=200361 RepID=A0A453C6P3_AEGTS
CCCCRRPGVSSCGAAGAAGTAWTCAAHIITAVIGSGVLSLAWGVAQLGWVAGPACMLCFAQEADLGLRLAAVP